MPVVSLRFFFELNDELHSSVHQSIFWSTKVFTIVQFVYFHIFPMPHIDYHLNWTFGVCDEEFRIELVKLMEKYFYPVTKYFERIEYIRATPLNDQNHSPLHISCVLLYSISKTKRKEIWNVERWSKVTRELRNEENIFRWENILFWASSKQQMHFHSWVSLDISFLVLKY